VFSQLFQHLCQKSAVSRKVEPMCGAKVIAKYQILSGSDRLPYQLSIFNERPKSKAQNIKKFDFVVRFSREIIQIRSNNQNITIT
jgi:hypothetical protein